MTAAGSVLGQVVAFKVMVGSSHLWLLIALLKGSVMCGMWDVSQLPVPYSWYKVRAWRALVCAAISPLQLGHGVFVVCVVGTQLSLACIRADIAQRPSQR